MNDAFSFPSREQLLETLCEAWTVEDSLLRILDHQAAQSNNAEACRLYLDHAELTRHQKQRLATRLRELGREPGKSTGGFARSLTSLARAGLWPVDLLERESQMMRSSYSTAQLECAMYRALEGVATRFGDTETADLARTHLAQEEAHGRRLWPYVGLLAELASGPRRVRALLA